MNITILYPHKRKTKSSTYGIAQMVLDRLLSGGTLHEFYLPQDMPHVCAGCYACMNGREDKCGGHEYMQKLIAAIDDSELIVFCAPTYVYHIPGQVKTLLDHFAYRWLVHRPDLSLMVQAGAHHHDRSGRRHEIHRPGFARQHELLGHRPHARYHAGCLGIRLEQHAREFHAQNRAKGRENGVCHSEKCRKCHAVREGQGIVLYVPPVP